MTHRVILDCQHSEIISDYDWDRYAAGELILKTCPHCGNRSVVTGDRVRGVMSNETAIVDAIDDARNAPKGEGR